MPIIASTKELYISKIVVQTREGNDISNEQSFLISGFEKSQFDIISRKFKNVIIKGSATGVYNCHGLAFASRRTMIYEPDDIWKILKEDKYTEITPKNVLPGDIVIYLTPEGDIEHSGIVISELEPTFHLPKIWSKWGKYYEVIHFVNNCPYDLSNLKYYRIIE